MFIPSYPKMALWPAFDSSSPEYDAESLRLGSLEEYTRIHAGTQAICYLAESLRVVDEQRKEPSSFWALRTRLEAVRMSIHPVPAYCMGVIASRAVVPALTSIKMRTRGAEDNSIYDELSGGKRHVHETPRPPTYLDAFTSSCAPPGEIRTASP